MNLIIQVFFFFFFFAVHDFFFLGAVLSAFWAKLSFLLILKKLTNMHKSNFSGIFSSTSINQDEDLYYTVHLC